MQGVWRIRRHKTMKQPHIHFVVGSTGAGKTTYSLKVAQERNALRYTIDEWMHTLFFPDLRPPITFAWAMERVERCEQQIWALCRQALAQGIDVVLEISMSTVQLRDKQRAIARSMGIPYTLHYLDVDVEERRRRVVQRNREKGAAYSFEVTSDMFDFVESMFEPLTAEELREAIVVQ